MQSIFRLDTKIGRITRIFILGIVFLDYMAHIVHHHPLRLHELASLVVFVLLFGIQYYYTRDGKLLRIVVELGAESVLLTTLVLLNPGMVPNAFLLAFVPVIFRCGRNLPTWYGIVAAIIIISLPIAGHELLRAFHIWQSDATRVDLMNFGVNLSWVFMFAPGWMLRVQMMANRKMQQLLDENLRQKMDLEFAYAELMQYTAEVEELATLRERNRMAREIHDTVGHALTSVIRGADACLEMIDPTDTRLQRHLQAMRDIAQESLEEIRKSVRSIQTGPAYTEHTDQWAALLANFARRVQETTGTSVVFETPIDIDTAKRYTVYQCMKEAVTNAIRHGEASQVTIAQRKMEQGEVIVITNNGHPPSRDMTKGFGLESMERRMHSIGGSLSCEKLNHGFEVKLLLSGARTQG